MLSSKGISPLMLAIVVIIIGLLTLVFVIVFFGGIGSKTSSEFFGLFKAAKPSCDEKCKIESFSSGECINSTSTCEGKIFTGVADCEEGKVCCCT